MHRPEDIGPIDVQRRNGVVHVAARDEAHAVDVARRYLAYFTAPHEDRQAPDPRLARHVVPENRLRAYDVRSAIDAIADLGSVLELRPDYGVGMVTALMRVEGASYGVLANSSAHLGGAIDAEAADKAADFLELCESHRRPVVSLCDTPGFMVGPESEKDATVRRFGRFFVAGARLTVPFGMIILRKATASARWRWPADPSTHPNSPSRGRRGRSAEWDSKGPCVSDSARNSTPQRHPGNARSCSTGSSPSPTSRARPCRRRRASNSTTSSTPPTAAPGSRDWCNRGEAGYATAMVTYPGAQEYVPDSRDLAELAAASAGCRGCDLYKAAERTVFGAGVRDARMLFVGEQPGNEEDLAGEPFVGPAGTCSTRPSNARVSIEGRCT